MRIDAPTWLDSDRDSLWALAGRSGPGPAPLALGTPLGQPAGVVPWTLYLLRTGDGALYTGVTTDVDRRLAEHRAGRGARSLRGRGPLRLVYRRRIGERGLALRVERAIKRRRKAEKEALVRARASRRRLLERLGIEG